MRLPVAARWHYTAPERTAHAWLTDAAGRLIAVDYVHLSYAGRHVHACHLESLKLLCWTRPR